MNKNKKKLALSNKVMYISAMGISFIITIDGPAGAGKSTVAKEVAKDRGFLYLDTGAMYRAVAYFSLKDGVAPQVVASSLEFDLEFKNGKQKVFGNGMDITEKIRTPEIDKRVSIIAKEKEIRDILVKKQREFAVGKRIVVDGRDTGSVVFPNADYKFYLDASVDIRAKRRYDELLAKGMDVELEEIKKDIKLRDEADRNREFGALIVPEGAIIIDTSDLSIKEVVQEIFSYINI